jgi:hypothetical protein
VRKGRWGKWVSDHINAPLVGEEWGGG